MNLAGEQTRDHNNSKTPRELQMAVIRLAREECGTDENAGRQDLVVIPSRLPHELRAGEVAHSQPRRVGSCISTASNSMCLPKSNWCGESTDKISHGTAWPPCASHAPSLPWRLA